MKTVINDDGYDEFDEKMKDEEKYNASLNPHKGVPSRSVDFEAKRREAEAVMARQDLPKDFPTAEESEKDVVGRAFKVVYTPIPTEIEGEEPELGIIEKEAIKPSYTDPNAYQNIPSPYQDVNIRLPDVEEIKRLNMEGKNQADALVTVGGVYRHALEALDGLLDTPIENVHAIEAVTNVLRDLKQIQISDTINPLATRAGEIPLRK